MSNENLHESAAKLDGKKEETDVAVFHCAVNFVPEDGDNVLVRIKEMGDKALTYKMNKSAFGNREAVKGENFTASIDQNSIYQSGQYLQGGNACIVDRDGGGEQPFNMREYLAGLDQDVAAQDSDIPFEV